MLTSSPVFDFNHMPIRVPSIQEETLVKKLNACMYEGLIFKLPVKNSYSHILLEQGQHLHYDWWKTLRLRKLCTTLTSVSHYTTLIIDCVSFKQAILSPTLWLLPWDAKWHLEMCMGAEEHLANVPMGAVQENDRADANRKPHKSLYLRTTIERDIKYMALKMVAVWNNWPCNISF